MLHRVHHGGPGREGDWAWTPPTGSRKPGEDLSSCVARELLEEVGWEDACPRPALTDDVDWAVFALEVPWGTQVVVDGMEHDRFDWVDFDEARRRCQPVELEASFLAGCKAADFG
jgi:8-oxo-dGTP pyrophosphatase MutT (NUDIX family)